MKKSAKAAVSKDPKGLSINLCGFQQQWGFFRCFLRSRFKRKKLVESVLWWFLSSFFGSSNKFLFELVIESFVDKKLKIVNTILCSYITIIKDGECWSIVSAVEELDEIFYIINSELIGDWFVPLTVFKETPTPQPLKHHQQHPLHKNDSKVSSFFFLLGVRKISDWVFLSFSSPNKALRGRLKL